MVTRAPSDGIAVYAKTHAELKSASLTSQKDADQIYSVIPYSGGRKNKMQPCAAQLGERRRPRA